MNAKNATVAPGRALTQTKSGTHFEDSDYPHFIKIKLCLSISRCVVFPVFLQIKSSRAYARSMTKGDLSSLRWTSAENRVKNNPEYEVAFAALNFRDVMLASGRLPAEAIPGKYFSRRFQNSKKSYRTSHLHCTAIVWMLMCEICRWQNHGS